ncbi:MAG: mevalonate kinase [Anaerolineaceae bacterium]|nr:mevalonate kinase [Anaerolineaceae bacterium]
MTGLKITSPAKTILFGEHAVVYGYPAIAIPVSQLKTTITIYPNPLGKSNDITIIAPDIGLHKNLTSLPKTHPFFTAFDVVCHHLGITSYPSCTLKITSTIPIASGLGSSASIAVSLIKAFSQFLGAVLPPQTITDLSYQVETIYHGTPSGIDNTVIGFEKGVIFQKEKKVQFLEVGKPVSILIANSGVHGKTKEAVSGVRKRWEQDKTKYETLFEKIGTITQQALDSLKTGHEIKLGLLMNENHACLQSIGVSHPKLDLLVNTARSNGAFGAKLCGGGLGGNMIALINPDHSEEIQQALKQAGATQTYLTKIESTSL